MSSSTVLALPVDATLLVVIVGGLGALGLGSVVRLLALRGVDDEVTTRSRVQSLKSWWGIALAVGVAALAGRTGVVLLLAGVGAAGFGEYVRLALTEWPRSGLRLEGIALIVVHYLLVWSGLRGGMVAFLPVAGLLWISLRLALSPRTAESVTDAATLLWGLLLCGYGLSHAAWFFSRPEMGAGPAGASGWFLYLVLLAQVNDIVQALVGRRLGSRRLAPRVSPHKTWEGFAAGLAVTVVLAVVLAPWLTSLEWLRAAGAGLLVAPAGLLGDLTVSALKRRAGADDSGTALPGQGGLLDRADSLLLSAPLFFYYLVLLP